MQRPERGVTGKMHRGAVRIQRPRGHSLGDLSRVIAPTGTYVMIGGPSGALLDPIPRVVGTMIRTKVSDQTWTFFVAQFNGPDLAHLADLAAQGRLRSAIDKRYPYNEAPEAVRYLETGRARGKVVVTVPWRGGSRCSGE